MSTTPNDAAAQADALTEADAVALGVQQKLDNMVAAREAIMAKVTVMGAQAARGAASLTHLAFLFAGAVREKLFAETDAEAVYAAYVKAHNDRVAAHEAATGVSPLEVSKPSVSMFRTFGKPAPVAQADLYQRVIVIRNEIAADDRIGSAYLTFVAVNRKLTEAFEADKGLADASKLVVTDDQLRAWCSKKAKPAKTDADRLAAVCAQLGNLVKSGKYAGLESEFASLTAYYGRFKEGRVGHAAALGTLVQMGGTEAGPSVH